MPKRILSQYALRVVSRAIAESGVSCETIADKIGVHFTMVYRWKRASGSPTEANLAKLAKVLGKPEGWPNLPSKGAAAHRRPTLNDLASELPGNFATRMRYARMMASLTTAELATRLGTCPSTITRWEVGEDRRPRKTSVDTLAFAMGVDPVWLITGKGSMVVKSTNETPDDITSLRRALDQLTLVCEHLSSRLEKHGK